MVVKDAVIEEDYEDDQPCACCIDGTVYDDNEILLCDKCDVPVHQSCYGITQIPEGDWYGLIMIALAHIPLPPPYLTSPFSSYVKVLRRLHERPKPT